MKWIGHHPVGTDHGRLVKKMFGSQTEERRTEDLD